MDNLFDTIPNELPQELVEILAESDSVRVQRIVSQGHASPAHFWYDQPDHEWVVLLSGRAKLRFEDESHAVQLDPGDYVYILPHRRHRVEWTDPDAPSVWLAIHFT